MSVTQNLGSHRRKLRIHQIAAKAAVIIRIFYCVIMPFSVVSCVRIINPRLPNIDSLLFLSVYTVKVSKCFRLFVINAALRGNDS